MAAGSLLALLDDIASVLDDVSILTKKAVAKTSGVLGDDLALNAQQVTGVASRRELPVVWAVAKGSMVNKIILVPLALLLSAVLPSAVTPLLMIGGLYLCFEGAEKLIHKFFHKSESHHQEALTPPVDEKTKIKGAIRTDFVLSAEIIAITLGTVADSPFGTRLMVLSVIAVIMTVGVYGLVAAIVKLDDLGVWLTTQKGPASPLLGACGKAILAAAPILMKVLSIVGTAAMFLVGGGILTHGIPPVHHAIENLAHSLHSLPFGGPLLQSLPPLLHDGLFGVIAGTLAALVVQAGIRLFKSSRRPA